MCSGSLATYALILVFLMNWLLIGVLLWALSWEGTGVGVVHQPSMVHLLVWQLQFCGYRYIIQFLVTHMPFLGQNSGDKLAFQRPFLFRHLHSKLKARRLWSIITCSRARLFSFSQSTPWNIILQKKKKSSLPPSLWMRRYEREKDSCYTYLTFIINWSVLLWRKVFLGRTFLWMGIASATYWCTRERRSPWPLMIKSDLIINGCSHVYPHQKDASFFMTRHMWHMACAGYKATN